MFKSMIASITGKRPQVVKPFGDNKDQEAVAFHLCGYDEMTAKALAVAFSEVDQVEVAQGDILRFKCDALGSPSNSFGEMSGGLDKAIDDFYDGQAQTKACAAIRQEYLGELPVGAGLALDMRTQQFPVLILAPTMRTPGNVSATLNAYLAMRGLLMTLVRYNAKSDNKIRHIAIPSLCTGVGGMDAVESATQMRAAFDNVVLRGWENVRHPAMAPFANR
ncbi:macro domain-containing protein [Hahella sp. NBU794]|uniref:macro domain-containing protein n=1 Tax=Hahella sp. NBU794 TaxID=3422590 RepID=UPI003D6FE3EA